MRSIQEMPGISVGEHHVTNLPDADTVLIAEHEMQLSK